MKLGQVTILLFATVLLKGSTCCEMEFHGFGVHLGSIDHLNDTNEGMVQKVLDYVYHDLKLRHFRTSYESYFSPSEGSYSLSCTNENCTWAWGTILKTLSNNERYPSPNLMASVWSPPSYMKDPALVTLKPEYESQYYYYLKNVTQLILEEYGLEVERVSPVNEPENIFAPWEHCNMDAAQLCRMVADFNDSLISLCPENSYFWITKLFMNYSSGDIRCMDSCQVIGTHAYSLNINFGSENFGLAAYDLQAYQNVYRGAQPVWLTEVSSTYHSAGDKQMEEGLDLATNIINFVGTTCVERYYFWLAYTNGASGESLMWGNPETGEVYLPKKYFIYNQFTNAFNVSSAKGPVVVTSCVSDNNLVIEPLAPCIHFDSNTTVYVNGGDRILSLGDFVDCSCGLCCTNEFVNISCEFNKEELPPKSVCTCSGGCGTDAGSQTTTSALISTPTEPDIGDGAGNGYRVEQLTLLVFGYVLIDNVFRLFGETT